MSKELLSVMNSIIQSFVRKVKNIASPITLNTACNEDIEHGRPVP
jgi:hypothetical protein